MSLCEIRNLRLSIARKPILSIDSLDIEAGACLGLVGESGSGKSMTALAMLGLLPPAAKLESGSIRFEGRELLGLSSEEMRSIRGNQIAMIFQEPSTCLNPLMRIGDQIEEVLELHRGLRGKAAREESLRLLERVGIENPESRLRQYPHQFSGGMRQRAMIAMAVACSPKLIIADEPTTSLDLTVQAQILELLKALQEEGIALLMISHDPGVIYKMAQKVVVMQAGRIVEEASKDTLFSEPRAPYTLELMRSYLSWAGY